MRTLAWNEEAEEAFANLNMALFTAPILKHPDPDKPFIVEVDASDTGVGAILSQHPGHRPKMHPVAFFSKK